MTGPRSDDDLDVPEWILSLGRLVGANEITVRWMVIRLKRRLSWLRRELSPPSRGFEHQICPGCGAVQEGSATKCGACDEPLGSKLTRTLRSLGLSIPSAVSVSSLLGLAMIAIYGRMILARPGQGIWSWDVPTLLAFGANWAPALREGQWYRLATSIFLHIGMWHIGFNLLALSQIGPSIEEIFGRGRMLFLFMLTGVAASAASSLGHVACSAGASGALMGLIGVAAGWGHRLGTTHGRNVRDQMLKWGAYTMIYGVVLRADHWAHGGGFVAGALLGFAFRPETLAHTKASRSSVGMAVVGGLAAAATVFLALAPPARSLELSQRMKEAWEADRQAVDDGEADDDAAPDELLRQWEEACALLDQGKRDEAVKKAGLDRPEYELEGIDLALMLDGYCASQRELAARCKRLLASGDAADWYFEGAQFTSDEQRRLALDAARLSCAQLARPSTP